MKASDLMIGGYYHHGAHWSYRQSDQDIKEFDFQWTEQDWFAVGKCTLNLDVISPIPLTEEWVEKHREEYWEFVGFGTRLIWQHKRFSAIKFEWVPSSQFRVYFNDALIGIKDFVHEWQNLFQSLAEEELIIKE